MMTRKPLGSQFYVAYLQVQDGCLKAEAQWISLPKPIGPENIWTSIICRMFLAVAVTATYNRVGCVCAHPGHVELF